MESYTTYPGPIDDSVLYDQDKHVSSAVWEGQERGALRCHEHTSKLDQWTLTPKQIDLVKKAGFGFLRLIPAISLDNPLISALAERWRRETNTFHLTVGEMTVTLEDVAYLLGLSIDGKPVIGFTYTQCDAVCLNFLGKVPDSGYTSGGMVKLSWLKETFSRCPEDALVEDVERHTRAYLLYLVGSTIFSTTTGNKVPVMYLPLFGNFEEAGKYAWGAAALSFLYRALGNASLKSQSTISGCLTLLQCWSYYHLSVGRPRLNQDPKHGSFPFVLRWKGKQSGPTTNRDVAFYRKALDSLKPSDVISPSSWLSFSLKFGGDDLLIMEIADDRKESCIHKQVEWCPYSCISHSAIPEDIRNTLILGRSNTMLICFDKAERHLPDRCLRQFGIQQPIPLEVPRWERKSRGVDGGVDLSAKMDAELKEWSERYLRVVEVVDVDHNVVGSDYMDWYLKITRRLVGRPIPISSEFQRMNAALREISHVADTIPTQGMDDQQMHAVSRIRYLAHECLHDQVGTTIVEVENTQNEAGKRVRGKQRVRRKGTGKRRRKNDPDPSHDTGEEVQPIFCVTPMEADRLPLCHVDNEIDHTRPCGDEARICYDDAHLADAVNEVDNTQFPQAVEEVDENRVSLANASQLSCEAVEIVPQSSVETSEDVAQQNNYSVLV